jgi:hypothetical protein
MRCPDAPRRQGNVKMFVPFHFIFNRARPLSKKNSGSIVSPRFLFIFNRAHFASIFTASFLRHDLQQMQKNA